MPNFKPTGSLPELTNDQRVARGIASGLARQSQRPRTITDSTGQQVKASPGSRLEIIVWLKHEAFND